jgi:uncharacterized protein YneF (UPF0154 family)
MTIDRSQTIKVPVWLLVFVTPLIIALGGTYIANKVSNARTDKQVEINTQKINNFPAEMERKVEKSEYRADMRNLQESLKRIETKLDGHIDK